MPSMEISGKTIEEALEDALEQLQVPPERVEVEVLEEPGKGVLGLGGNEARIRVTVLKPSALEAERFLTTLFGKMGIEAELEHRLGMADEGPAIIDVRGSDLGILIGWRGDTLRALQLITNGAVRQALTDAEAVVIDVERYRARREDSVRELALRAADRAKRNQERIGLEPMQPYERRVVHTTLADDPDLSTESEGEDAERRVVITPKDATRQEVVEYSRPRPFGSRDGGRDGDRGGHARGGYGGGREGGGGYGGGRDRN